MGIRRILYRKKGSAATYSLTSSNSLSRTQVTDTESLRSSILAHKWENGRRYHAYEDGSYW